METAEDNNFREYLTICLGFTNDNSALPSEVKSEIIRLAKNSKDGYVRSLVMRILEKCKDPNLVSIFEEGLNDNFKIAVKTDLITPDAYKGEDGYYYYDSYPVKDEAASALRKMGVLVERQGNIFKIKQ